MKAVANLQICYMNCKFAVKDEEETNGYIYTSPDTYIKNVIKHIDILLDIYKNDN